MKKRLLLIIVLFFSLIASAAIVIVNRVIFYCPKCGSEYTFGDWVYRIKDSVYIYTCSNCGLENEVNQEEFDEAVRKLEKTLADQTKSEADVK